MNEANIAGPRAGFDPNRAALAWLAVIVAGAGLMSASAAAAGPARKETGDAQSVARRTLQAMGGRQSLDSLRTLRFAFVVERDGEELGRINHVWDRLDGRYRVEGTDREGHEWLALFNVADRIKGGSRNRHAAGGRGRGSGRAWQDGEELEGDARDEMLERAWGRYINDTYWLLMPAKMLDPGVVLEHEGRREEGGREFDVVRLTFDDGVGLTPGDSYWAWVSVETGLMDRWDFVLEGWEEGREPSTFLWTDWRRTGGLLLSAVKTSADGTTVIRFDGLSGSTEPDPRAFEGR